MDLSYNELQVVDIVSNETGVTIRRLTSAYGHQLRSAAWGLLDKGILRFNSRWGLYFAG